MAGLFAAKQMGVGAGGVLMGALDKKKKATPTAPVPAMARDPEINMQNRPRLRGGPGMGQRQTSPAVRNLLA